MSVYDNSGVSPVLVQGPSAMTNVVGNTYSGKFTADANKSYVIFKAVYTSSGFTTLSPDYSQGSESIYSEDLSSGSSGGGCEIIGLVDNNDQVIGVVEC